MKKINIVITILMLLPLVLCFSGCKEPGVEPEQEHIHTFSEEWSGDDTYHWHSSTCEHKEEVSEKAEHILVDGTCACGYSINNPNTQSEWGNLIKLQNEYESDMYFYTENYEIFSHQRKIHSDSQKKEYVNCGNPLLGSMVPLPCYKIFDDNKEVVSYNKIKKSDGEYKWINETGNYNDNFFQYYFAEVISEKDNFYYKKYEDTFYLKNSVRLSKYEIIENAKLKFSNDKIALYSIEVYKEEEEMSVYIEYIFNYDDIENKVNLSSNEVLYTATINMDGEKLVEFYSNGIVMQAGKGLGVWYKENDLIYMHINDNLGMLFKVPSVESELVPCGDIFDNVVYTYTKTDNKGEHLCNLYYNGICIDCCYKNEQCVGNEVGYWVNYGEITLSIFPGLSFEIDNDGKTLLLKTK